MKKISRVKTALAMLLLAGMIAAIAGCGGSALAGKWAEIKDGEPSGNIMEFFADGTADYAGIKGEWKAEKDQLMCSIWGITVAYTYKISGSTLTLIDDDGSEEIFKKVKK